MTGYQDVTWRIEGITCQKCVRLITEALQGFAGVSQVLVSKELSSATARVTEDCRDPVSSLEEAIQKLVNGKFTATKSASRVFDYLLMGGGCAKVMRQLFQLKVGFLLLALVVKSHYKM